jgi:hypothetical protein
MLAIGLICITVTLLVLAWCTWYVMRPIELRVGDRCITQQQVTELYRHDIRATALIERVLSYDSTVPYLPNGTRDEMRQIVRTGIDHGG